LAAFEGETVAIGKDVDPHCHEAGTATTAAQLESGTAQARSSTPVDGVP
jgi:hypothetical protein